MPVAAGLAGQFMVGLCRLGPGSEQLNRRQYVCFAVADYVETCMLGR